MLLDYDSGVRTRWVRSVLLGALLVLAVPVWPVMLAEDDFTQGEPPLKSEPQYDDVFSGPVVALAPDKLTVSRDIMGKKERRTFLIKSDTRIEGKLKMKARVTVGYVKSDEGDVARLIVVRGAQHK